MRPFFRRAPPGSCQLHGDLLVLWSAWAKLPISRFILVSGEYRDYSRERSRAQPSARARRGSPDPAALRPTHPAGLHPEPDLVPGFLEAQHDGVDRRFKRWVLVRRHSSRNFVALPIVLAAWLGSG